MEQDELIPLQLPKETPSSQWLQLVRTIFLGTLVISLSVGLININSYLMKPGRFPFAGSLVLVHMVFCSFSAAVLFAAKPSLFPSMTDPMKQVTLGTGFFLQKSLPVALSFSGSLVLTNMAYIHLSIAFLQMLKEANVVLVYIFSILVSLEAFTQKQAGLIGIIILATTLTIRGEVHFSTVGFFIQSGAILCECVRITLQGLLMSGGGKKLDPLSYVLLISPVCTVILGTGLYVFARVPPAFAGAGMQLPQAADFQAWWHLLLLDSAIAFGLNVSIATLITYTSPMAYVLCQILKDITAVLTGIVVWKETVSRVQAFGFMLQILAVLTWSLLKTFPNQFEGGLLLGLQGLAFPTSRARLNDKSTHQ